MKSQETDRKTWETTATANLLRHKGGTFYFRVQVAGKRKLVSLRTKKLSVAKLRAAAEQTTAIQARESGQRAEEGIATVGDLIRIYSERFEADSDIGLAAKRSRREQVQRIKRTWPDIATTAPRRITFQDIVGWANRLHANATQAPRPFYKTQRKGYSAEVVNKTLEALRRILQIGIEKGVLSINPFEQRNGQKSARKKVAPKKLELPPIETMERLFAAIGTPPARALADSRPIPALESCAKDSEELARGMAYTGMRLAEAQAFAWEDVGEKEITVRGTKTETSAGRKVPIVPAMDRLLAGMRQRREAKNWSTSGQVFRVSECQKSINRACAELKINRLTHHDCRHYFATTCIHSGVDVPTVSKWLGHADGGALAMRTYCNNNPDHSLAAASKVSFGTDNLNT
jgi:integrase